jgi:2-oxoisovalerate dehydrogenase E2 component (dihydrolipoyl transacylase)
MPGWQCRQTCACLHNRPVLTSLSLVPAAAAQGTKLTFLPFIVKALSLALLKHPEINSCLASGGDALLQHHTHNIGVAMATASGLVVPNVKQVGVWGIPRLPLG